VNGTSVTGCLSEAALASCRWVRRPIPSACDSVQGAAALLATTAILALQNL
jgi:hypothetical protein